MSNPYVNFQKPKEQNSHHLGTCPVSIRTPDARFLGIQDWPYKPNYTEDLGGFSGLRLHYVDEGDKNNRRTALCLHGQKTWSYAFRKAIPHFISDSYRVIAPDLFGFGKSDKIRADDALDFSFHKNTILALIKHLQLDNITIVGFDWGTWLGVALALECPNKVNGLLLGNAMLPQEGFETWPGFHLWKSVQNAQANPAIGTCLSDDNTLSAGIIAAYEAPFPSAEYKAAIRRFPNMIPTHEVDPLTIGTSKALAYLKTEWRGKSVCVSGQKDTPLAQKRTSQLQANIRNAARLIKVEKAGPLVFEHADKFMPLALENLK